MLYKNCIVCHRTNDIAPMSLMTYKDTRPWARAIREALVQRKMPPWHADPKVGDFINDPRLADSEIRNHRRVSENWYQGRRCKDLPPAPVFLEGTKAVTTAYFDNSFDNAQNPDPSRAIRWGEPSDEEMMGFWLQFADPKLVDEKAAIAHK